MTLTLVALAAGMGSRFGGPKQLEPLGPCGETILDFSIHDAKCAGFDQVVLVIRPEMHEAFAGSIVSRWRPHLPVSLVHQRMDVLSPGLGSVRRRKKPWGTGHAVLSAAAAVAGAFAVVNADDFYGVGTFAGLAEFLAHESGGEPAAYAVVGFPLTTTLSEAGPVNRALLRTTADGWLEHVEEVVGIEAIGRDGRCLADDGSTRVIPGDALVSMNMWGLTPAVFLELADGFRAFLAAHAGDGQAGERTEFPLPTHVEALIRSRRVRVRVLAGGGPWCGMTYPEDRPRVARVLREVVESGGYPRPVWA